MKKIINVLRKIVISGFTIVAFNFMVSPLNFVIPINIVTILFTCVFGVLSLPFFSILIMFFF